MIKTDYINHASILITIDQMKLLTDPWFMGTCFSLKYAAAWTSHYFQCKKVNIEKVKIVSHSVPHNDGIDIDACQNVRISDCDIQSGYDARSSKPLPAKWVAKTSLLPACV